MLTGIMQSPVHGQSAHILSVAHSPDCPTAPITRQPFGRHEVRALHDRLKSGVRQTKNPRQRVARRAAQRERF